ncbi:MAG: serpin family protein [Opitutaceae bacterium]
MKSIPLLAALAVMLPHSLSAVDFDAASATNHVGLELFRRLAADKPGTNLILSPYSIESALALAYAGADGETRTEMARVLRFPSDTAPLQTAFAAMRAQLDALATDSVTAAENTRRNGGRVDILEWHAANRLFGQRSYAFRDAFLTLMRNGFAAPFDTLDFRADPDRARGVINGWVEEQTRKKIRDLIPRGALGDDTRLVLVNALYLKAPWQKPFEKSATQPASFHNTRTEAHAVPTMQRTGPLGYASEPGVTIVSLDYIGRGLRFLVLLPDRNQTVDELAARLTPADFTRWAGLGEKTPPTSVRLFLPKFRVEGTTLPLGKTLRTLGMKSAFDEPRGSANFDRIAPRKPNDYLAISDVFHQTFIALDEEGTEAAAATAVAMMALTSIVEPAQPIEVRVDRPFLFAIQHRASGACLFLGRIASPR